MSTEDVRKCHSGLLLTCENTEMLELFSLIIFGPKTLDIDKNKVPETVLLNRFRNLARKELGFGNEISFDEDRAWFGFALSDEEMYEES